MPVDTLMATVERLLAAVRERHGEGIEAVVRFGRMLGEVVERVTAAPVERQAPAKRKPKAKAKPRAPKVRDVDGVVAAAFAGAKRPAPSTQDGVRPDGTISPSREPEHRAATLAAVLPAPKPRPEPVATIVKTVVQPPAQLPPAGREPVQAKTRSSIEFRPGAVMRDGKTAEVTTRIGQLLELLAKAMPNPIATQHLMRRMTWAPGIRPTEEIIEDMACAADDRVRPLGLQVLRTKGIGIILRELPA